MRSTLNGIATIIIIAVVLGIVLPLAAVAIRIADTWTEANTNQIIGGGLTCLGFMAVMTALVVGFFIAAAITKRRTPQVDATMYGPPLINELPNPDNPYGLPGPNPFPDARRHMLGRLMNSSDLVQDEETTFAYALNKRDDWS